MRAGALLVAASLAALAIVGAVDAQQGGFGAGSGFSRPGGPGGSGPGGPAGGSPPGGGPRPPAAPGPGVRPSAPPPDPLESVTVDGVTYSYATPELFAAVERGRTRELMAIFERVAADAERRSAKPEAVMAYGGTVFMAKRLGQIQKAIGAGTRALAIVKELPSPYSRALAPMIGSIYMMTGLAYTDAGDFTQARAILDAGVAEVRAGRLGTRDSSGITLRYAVALTALWQRDIATALSHAGEALTLAETTLGNLSPGAPEPVRQTYRRHIANLLTAAGRAHLQDNRLAEAEAALTRARVYARQAAFAEVEVSTLLLAAQVARQRRDGAAARKHLDEALGLARKLGHVLALTRVHANIAYAESELGRPAEALTAAREAIALIEQMRSDVQDTSLRSGFLDERQRIYHVGVGAALALQRVDESFALAERSRARAFLDLLGSQTVSKGKTRALVDEEVQLRARLAEARATLGDDGGAAGRRALEAAERDYRAFLERVRAQSAEQASLMAVEPITLSEIQQLLPEKTTLLEYLVTEREVIVWIVERDRATVRRLPVDRAALVARVRELRAAIATLAPLGETEAHAEALYRELIAGVRADIRGDRLLVVPHDVLHYLPFAALRSPGGTWLVQDFALSTLPSASVLKFIVAKGADAGATALAIGNPDLGPALNLRWAEREARFVGQRIPGATVLVRGDATEARAKALLGGAGLVHVASHGELNEADPLGSALLLTPDGDDDGRLEVRELFGVEIKARLVVLSACETGLGRLSRGDELVGLQRAFLYAGTPAVITTLWKVDDRASYDLVRAFYDALAADDPVRALRQAQLTTMGVHPHPFAWAAFSLTGAPR